MVGGVLGEKGGRIMGSTKAKIKLSV